MSDPIVIDGVFPGIDSEHGDGCIECQLTILWNDGVLQEIADRPVRVTIELVENEPVAE